MATLVGFVFVAGVAVFASEVFSNYNNKPSLPYSRPHIEFVKPDETRCVAWIKPQAGVYVMLCENQEPEFIAIHNMRNERRG